MSGPVNYDDVLGQLRGVGLIVDHLVIGRMQRVMVEGSREKKGWYSLHQLQTNGGDEIIVGSYGIWQGNNNNAQKVELTKQNLSADQKAALKTRLAEDRKRADADRQRQIESAAKRADAVWKKSLPTGESEYLTRKGIQPFGVRFTDTGSIVIPMQDNSARIYGLQFILPNGHPRKVKTGRDKEFWPVGMAMKGHYFIIGGTPHKILLVAEGYATAATLHQASGYPVAVAFNANNLLPVAENLRKRYRGIKQLICADDDYLTDGNPGVSSAQAAALAVSGAWVKPEFITDRAGKKLTDFNDLQILDGLHVVQSQIEQVIHSLGWVSDVPSRVGTLNKGTGDALKSLLSVQEAVERWSLIYGAGGTMYDHQEYSLIPKSDVLDVCVDHAWREWKLHADRRVVRLTEVGFDPTDQDKSITCNLWGGWPTVPKKGPCDILLDLLRYLCSGEETKGSDAIYQWVLKWLAYPIQHRGAKMRTSLIFHGPQGAGKNLFFEAYSAIYGEYGRIIGQAEIDDKFNDWASRKLFMIADEVVARQELFHIKNKIKALITGETIRINPKNVTAHDERNHVNIVFLSNEVQPLVLEKDDRRFVVVWVPDKLPDNYYSDVAEEIAAGGIAALHDYLLNLDLGDFTEHTKPPMTKAKQDLIDINLESGQRFVEDWLNGELGVNVMPAETKDIYRLYQHWARKNGVSRPRELSQLVGGMARIRGWVKDRKRVFKTLHFDGDPVQVSMIITPDEATESDRRRNGRPESQWLTDCYIEFKNQVDALFSDRGGPDD